VLPDVEAQPLKDLVWSALCPSDLRPRILPMRDRIEGIGLSELMGDQKAILIIEDDTSVCDALTIVLEDAGYFVASASTARSGLEKADEQRFDVIITDIRLPDRSGLDVIRETHSKDPSCVILAISAYSTPQVANESLRLGARGLLSKPFSPSELLNWIARELAEPVSPTADHQS
jgi:two-component system, NtrC family, response regulator HydG